MLTNRTIALSTISATICAAIGLALAIANVFLPYDVGTLGAAFLAAAVTISIRSALAQHLANWHSAYEVGKEAGLRRIPTRE